VQIFRHSCLADIFLLTFEDIKLHAPLLIYSLINPFHCGSGGLIRYSDSLRAECSGDRIAVFRARPDRPWGPPGSCNTMSIGSVSRG